MDKLTRLVITLSIEERLALGKLAQQEMRDPREQIRYILIRELRRIGLLPDEQEKQEFPKSDNIDQ